MTRIHVELTPELIRLARENRTALQRLSLLVRSFEAQARADDVRHVLRHWPQAWGESRYGCPPPEHSFIPAPSRGMTSNAA